LRPTILVQSSPANVVGIEAGPPSGQLVGRSVGTYDITALLGAGGMGEVYRARDRTLGREVAIKVLSDTVARHSERLARFEREARLLASLSHPNVAVVHGLERDDRLYYLVMELVRGETLAERIARGPILLTEAISLFRQIADGLEAAHTQTIVHRDLKPANVMITAQGAVKLLDFGLAKVVAGGDSDTTLSPTIDGAPTVTGLVVGTLGYMSPEQARGDAVDRRTDVWAFGCLLFESLTAQRAFPGRTVSDIIATILKEEPDWSALSAVAPPRLQLLIRRCLQKNPRGRLHDIADARIELEDIARDPSARIDVGGGAAKRRVAPTRTAWAAVVTLLVASVAGAGFAIWSAEAPDGAAPVARLTIPLMAGQVIERGRLPSLAISPDGTQVVYAAAADGGRTRLFLRPVNELAARPIPASEGASVPFFSPDGRWLAFHADGRLKKISLGGGVPLTVCVAPAVLSANWGDGERIIFATASEGLWLVSAEGGEPTQLTQPESPDTPHAYPQLLPGGDTALFSVQRGDGWQLGLLDIDSRRWRLLGDGRAVGQGAQFVADGYVVYAQSGGLVGVPFDPRGGTLDESAVPLLERVDTSRAGTPFAIASAAGSLVYVPAAPAAPERSMVRVDRDGRTVPLVDDRAAYESLGLAPDGRTLAAAVASNTGSDIWIVDMDRKTRIRFTTDGFAAGPVWSADGTRIAFQSTAPGTWNLFWKPIGGGGAEPFVTVAAGPSILGAGVLPGSLPTLSGAGAQFPESWASDGTLAFTERKAGGERDIWTLAPGGTPAPFLLTPFDERFPRFSHDGRWLAYVSDEAGRDEVYVQPFPGPGGKWLISREGGTDPVWSRTGRELFYRAGNQIMAVPVTTAGDFSAGAPRRLFQVPSHNGESHAPYDVSPDGTWFAIAAGDGRVPGELHIVLNWFGELASRVPSAAGER
jgi:Tol biopolymer transport system component